MNLLKMELEHCYGIRKLKYTFDFTKGRAVAIYAPNGAMKSSLAKTFQDIADKKETSDRMFPSRVNRRYIVDENGTELDPGSILIVRPYDEDIGSSGKTSTLLVNADLRKEYEELNSSVDTAKDSLLTAMKQQSGSKKDLETEISSTFTRTTDQFETAVLRVSEEVDYQPDAPFADIPYDLVFDDKVVNMLEQGQVRSALEDYVKRFNELIDQSAYFKRGTFTYYNAAVIVKALTDNGFFDATHSVSLNAEKKLEVTSKDQFEKLITDEKKEITSDDALRRIFEEIEKLLNKNISVRNFNKYLGEHEDILPALANVANFKEQVWKSYFVEHREYFNQMVTEIRAAEERKREIEEKARRERTSWQEVIDIFNNRFSVPFELELKNHVSMVLEKDKIAKLSFTFKEQENRKEVDKDALLEVLSTGELRAFYILNIIFEIRAREKEGQKTLIIVDDIADSFDYKNKFAIIQYLKDISEGDNFWQIILTHNFDFFRTVQSRFVNYSSCFMATRNEEGIEVTRAVGIKNIFVNDWKIHFEDNPRKRIACIPFMRNLIEFTKGNTDPDYGLLTSLLHVKKDTQSITDANLFEIYERIFGVTPSKTNQTSDTVMDMIYREADQCLHTTDGTNFENKIVLSIAIRLCAEQYMLRQINNSALPDELTGNQTTELLRRFRQDFPEENAISVIERVVLMTPENIHLNSFMYEPILDMSDDHLRRLYAEIKILS